MLTGKIGREMERARHHADFAAAVNGTNRMHAYLQHLRRLANRKIHGYPAEIAPEASSWCFLHCKFCWIHELGISDKRENRFMPMETFRRIVDTAAVWGPRLTFAGCGEPLANSKIYSMVRYAADRNLRCLVVTNSLLLNEKNAERLIDSGAHRVRVSIGMFDRDEYEKTRPEGDYDQVMRNLERFISLKRETSADYPLIEVQTILTQDTAGRVDEFLAAAKEIGADLAYVKTLGIYPQASREYNKWIIDNLYIPHLARYHLDGNGEITWERIGPCPARHGPAYITTDGDLLSCQYDIYGDHKIGNLKDTDLTELWGRWKEFRDEKMLNRSLDLCDFCGDTTKVETDIPMGLTDLRTGKKRLP